MATWQQAIQRVQTGWRVMPRAQQVSLLMLAIVFIGGWLWLAPRTSSESWTPLFDGTTLSNDDINRIEIALAQSNIVKFRNQDQMVLVLPTDRARCLQALAELGALPTSIQSILDKPPASDPFATREDRRALMQFNRKNRIRNMLADLPFVDQVRVELDQTAPQSVYQKPNTTCAVSILAKNELILTAEQVHTIREMIVALVADIDRDQIFIMDLAAGTAIQDDGAQSISASHEALDQRRRRQDLQHQLESSLAGYPDLKIEVTLLSRYSSIAHQRSLSEPNTMPGPMLQPTKPAALDSIEKHQLPPYLKPGSNGQISIKTLLEQSNNAAVSPPQQPPTESKPNPIPTRTASHANTPFGVSIKVPATTLDAFIVRESKNWAGQNAEWAINRDIAFTRLKNRIQADILGIMNEFSAPDAAQTHLSIDLIEPQPLASSTASRIQLPVWLNGKPAGAILAIASGLSLVAFVVFTAVRRAAKRRTTRECLDQTPELDTAPTTIELRQQIDRLIKNDPDTAARVIQQWIRKAG